MPLKVLCTPIVPHQKFVKSGSIHNFATGHRREAGRKKEESPSISSLCIRNNVKPRLLRSIKIMSKCYCLMTALLTLCGTLGASAVTPVDASRIRIHNGASFQPALEANISTRSAGNPQTDCVATEASFYYTGEFMSGAGGYQIMLSNAGLDKTNPTHAGQMARLYILAEPEANPSAPTLPVGTFTSMPGETFDIGYFAQDATDFLDVFDYPEDPSAGLVCYSWRAIGGTITISKDDNGIYTITADIDAVSTEYDTDDEEEQPEDVPVVKCTASYTGEVPYVNYNAYDPIPTDREVTVAGVSGRYEEMDGIGIYSISFYNVPLDPDGFIIGAGDLLNMECYVEADGKMNLDRLCGVYTPSDIFVVGMIQNRFMQGIWYNIFGEVWGAFGTALSVYQEDGRILTGLATGGDITVSKGDKPEEYTVEFNLTTPEDKKITAKWTGRLADYVADQSTDSVEELESEKFSVSALGGEIVAPEGAIVYDLTGRRVGRSNLPSGVYVVRYAGISQKVIMK